MADRLRLYPPIQAEGDEIGSVVVTMQDLAPLDEIERTRTEFLGLVSHELRAPLLAIKGSADAALEEAAELDPAETREFFRIIAEQAGFMRGLIRDLLDAGRIDAGTLSVAAEPSEVAALVEHARSTFLSGGGRPAVLVDLPAGLPAVMADRRRIVQVLNRHASWWWTTTRGRCASSALSEAGYAPLLTGKPHDLPRIIRTERPRLVLLDLMLPDADGIELMGQVSELADLPVIFISGYRRDETVAKALEAGAADDLVKLFSPTELVARVRAALRRCEDPEPFVVGDLAIDYAHRRVTVGGEAVDLTPRSTSCCACSRSTRDGS